MAIEPAIPPQPAVRPVKDTERNRSDSQSRRDGKKRLHYDHHEDAGPTPNDRGEMTGKVIDILA